ncbi:phenazine biosynthesis protein [Streptococcus troglodytae]|uniref:Phenazine biosynthesis protein n=1 Tax=Streptococcus troglodytae TaxID=1111760 RepID=A0A1L7LJZ1_9STRE|nr:phenazine biosynthesis protein [Streptococcus troglodytae]
MKQYIVDAFTNEVFKGNPAAVCLVDRSLTEEQILAIARENNLSETAFIEQKQRDTVYVGSHQEERLISVVTQP